MAKAPTAVQVGQRYGRLLVVAGPVSIAPLRYRVRCDCGTERDMPPWNMRRKVKPTRSCGCLTREKSSERLKVQNHKHGMSGQGVYWIWHSMLARCRNKNDPLYGGRGIKVCERWMQFANFATDMGERPPGKTIDRINVDGDYEPGNCRWATQMEQGQNQRTNVLITYQGETLTLSEWARRRGLYSSTLSRRLRNGWPPERALAPPKARQA